MPKNLTVRLDEETREKLELIAEREIRPLANQIVFFVQQSIEPYLKQHNLYFEQSLDEGDDEPILKLKSISY